MLCLRDTDLGKAEVKFKVWSTAYGGHSSKSLEQGDARLIEEQGTVRHPERPAKEGRR